MGTPAPLGFLLLLLVALTPTLSQTGSHSLSYLDFGMSRPGLEPWYIFTGYVDDTLVVYLDSDAQSQRLEPRGPWVEKLPPEYWEQWMSFVKYRKQVGRVLEQAAIKEYNLSQNASEDESEEDGDHNRTFDIA